ncbi:MAG: hypothetical protein ACREIH_02710 [Nitrospiraceae bacterium]
MRHAVLLVCFLGLSLSASLADETIPIAKVLAAPDSYHLKSITLQGKIQQLMLLTPSWAFNRECYAAKFFLHDNTGSIEVLMPGPCGNPTLNPAPVLPYSEGDRIILEARVQAPGYYTGQGLPPGGEVRKTAQAIVIKVRSALD